MQQFKRRRLVKDIDRADLEWDISAETMYNLAIQTLAHRFKEWLIQCEKKEEDTPTKQIISTSNETKSKKML